MIPDDDTPQALMQDILNSLHGVLWAIEGIEERGGYSEDEEYALIANRIVLQAALKIVGQIPKDDPVWQLYPLPEDDQIEI